ncbi:MaoC family dehydratase [Erythrobacter sp. T5W1-R]|uniref:MaoC family dehydratase n=1 Tax=Erythrobacter sp. T5W1-R TaxID=3101752 RepID=UPI002AFDD760|nr:MaoC family dehydratase [Erythrobacter sp. T5W1-R]MEA1618064.1 MaoC family dehydratase [Erythrobacter sp. T5W1-R]
MSGLVERLTARIGETWGPSDWMTIDQPMITAYADLSGDRQWIHIDVERALREGPFGAPVAHGLLIFSLVPAMLAGVPWLEAKAGVNYGTDRLRFVSPVRPGDRIRCHASLTAVQPHGEGARLTTAVVVEVEGQAKPACIADMIGIVFV